MRPSTFFFSLLLFALPTSNVLSDEAWQSGRQMGYLMIYAEVEAENASMHIRAMGSPKKQTIEIKLSGEGDKRWVRKALKAGSYTVVSVNVPYFNLPFRLDTIKEKGWTFNVRSDASNYFGTLYINRERTKNSVEVKRWNRFVTQYSSLSEFVGINKVKFPIRSAFTYQDDFAREFVGAKNE